MLENINGRVFLPCKNYLCVAQLEERKFGELEAVGSRPITETSFRILTANLIDLKSKGSWFESNIRLHA